MTHLHNYLVVRLYKVNSIKDRQIRMKWTLGRLHVTNLKQIHGHQISAVPQIAKKYQKLNKVIINY